MNNEFVSSGSHQAALTGMDESTVSHHRSKFRSQIDDITFNPPMYLDAQLLFDKSPVALACHQMIFDDHGVPVDYYFIAVNQQFIEFTGVDPTGKLATEAFPGIENDPANWMKKYGEMVLNNSSTRFTQFFALNKKWYDCVAYTYSPKNFLVSFIDITESKIHKEQVQTTAHFYQTIIENAPDGIALIDINNRFLFISNAGWRMFGYDNDSIVQLDLAQMTHPDDLPLVLETLTKVIAEEKGKHCLKYRFITKDARWRWIETSFVNMLQNPSVAAIVMNFRDITEQHNAEAALLEKENQFRNLANTGIALVWQSGTDMLCNYFNNAWLQFTGRTLEQELGDGWAESVHADDLNHCMKTYVNAFNKQEAFEMEYRMLRADGEYRWIFDMGKPNYSSSGEFLGYIGNCFDVTERKRSEAEFKEIIENNPLAIQVLDLKGRVIIVNSSHTRLFGAVPPADYSIFDDEQLMAQGFQPYFDKLRNGEVVQFPDSCYNMHTMHPEFPDKTLWIRATAFAIKDEQSVASKFIIMQEDITQRKEMEDNLAASELMYRLLVQRIPDGVYKSTPEGYFMEVNPAMVQMFGYDSKEELMQIHIPSQLYFNEEDRKGLVDGYDEDDILIFKLKKKDGSIIWVEEHGWINRDAAGQVVSHEGVIRDVTARRKAEEMLVENQKQLNNTLYESTKLIDAKIGSIDYQQMVNTIGSLSGASYVAFNLFEENGFDFKTVALFGDYGRLKTIIDLVGVDFKNNIWKGSAERNEKLSQGSLVRFPSVLDVMHFTMPRAIVNMLGKMYDIGQAVIVPINKGDKIVGDFTLFFNSKTTVKNEELVVLYANQVGLYLERSKSEQQLMDKVDEMSRFHKLTVDRELNMIGLKMEVNELLKAMNKPPKYKIVD